MHPALYAAMTDENTKNAEDQKDGEPIEEFALSDLERILADKSVSYYCVDTLWTESPRRKLIDPKSLLSPSIISSLYEWGLSPNRVIRVTQWPDEIDRYLELSEMDISHYSYRLHHYMVKIFNTKKDNYRPEIQGLTRTAVEMLDKVFSYSNIVDVTVGPNDVRTYSSYYDHLVNTAVYWLAAFSAINRQRRDHPGAVESWRTKNKAEMSKLTAGSAGRAEFSVFYDISDRDAGSAELEKLRKGDLNLVLSGFYGALFHDISLLHEQTMLIPKKDTLDEKMKGHPDASNKIIKEKLSILADERPLAKNIIKYHHELIDGSGYPTGKTEKNIHQFGQLLAIVDIYDEYTKLFRRGTVLRYLKRGAGRFLAADLVKAFFTILRPYEIGESVDVYDEKNPKQPVMRGVILESANRFRPSVKISDMLASGYTVGANSVLDLSKIENAELSI